MLQSLMYPNMVKIVASNDDTEDGKHSFQPYHVEVMLNIFINHTPHQYNNIMYHVKL